MTKSELVEKMAQETEQPHTVCTSCLDAFCKTVMNAVAADDKVQLSGFGTFERRKRAARTGVNPRTGEAIAIDATKVPAFKAGAGFRKAVKS